MVDVHALQDAYNDAVAKGNKKLAEQLLVLWHDALLNRAPKRPLPTNRREASEASREMAL